MAHDVERLVELLLGRPARTAGPRGRHLEQGLLAEPVLCELERRGRRCGDPLGQEPRRLHGDVLELVGHDVGGGQLGQRPVVVGADDRGRDREAGESGAGST